jgi:lysophospholipase L1-like esterase
LRAANFGIGGDRTQQLLWRIQHGTLEGIEPKLVVLLIGVNNLWPMTHSPSEVVDGISAVVSEIQGRLPRAQILLQGILPTGEAADGPYRGTIKSINSILAESDFGPSVRFINLGDLYLEADGTISAAVMPDFCHLSAEAYSVWANACASRIATGVRFSLSVTSPTAKMCAVLERE